MEQRYNFLKANQHPEVVKEVFFIFFKLFTHLNFSLHNRSQRYY
jgi:hypothetical protein